MEMTKDEIRDACAQMSRGQKKTFTLSRDWRKFEIALLTAQIDRQRNDDLAVSLRRNDREIYAHCYHSDEDVNL